MTDKSDVGIPEIVYFRVYATNDFFYNSKSEEIKEFQPVIIDDFPTEKLKLKFFFGKVPDEIIKIKNHIDAYGLMRLYWISNQLDRSKTGPEQFKDCLREIETKTSIFSSHKWYTTIVLEGQTTDIQDKILNESGKLDLSKGLKYLNDLKNEGQISQKFDKITIVLMNEFLNLRFSKLFFEDAAIMINNEPIIMIPEIQSSANLTVGSRKESIDKEKLVNLILKICNPENEWLDNIAYWRTAMLKEKDKWKKFYFGYLALELLINKYFKRINNRINNDFKLFVENNKDVDPQNTDRILNKGGDPSPVVKFAFLALIFHPDLYSEDLEKFKEIKDIRDDMSHGKLKETNDLKIYEIEDLLSRYITAIVEKK